MSVLPVLELEGPHGRRRSVTVASPDERVGDLADVLGIGRHRPVVVDGRPVSRHDTLARAGVVRGSRLDDRQGAVDPPHRVAGPVLVVCDAGPDAGRAIALPPGRHVLGRSVSAAVTIADPGVEPHHALVDVGADGNVRFLQLAGRVPCRVAGVAATGAVLVGPGEPVTIGASRVVVRERAGDEPDPARLGPAPGDPWRRTLHRTPRAVVDWAPTPVPVPAAIEPPSRPGGAGVVAALSTAAGSVLVAAVMRSPAFLLFAAVGVLASVGVWAAGTVGAGRRNRRDRDRRRRESQRLADDVAAQRSARWAHLLATTPAVGDAVDVATQRRAGVWARRSDHADATRAVLGWGPVPWDVTLDAPPGTPLPSDVAATVEAAGRFPDAPVACDLGGGAAVAVRGPGAAGVARSLVAQLATWTGPADWRLVVVVDEPTSWGWCRWLPHAVDPAGASTVAHADDDGAVADALRATDDGRHVVVVTDRPELLVARTGALRRFLATARSVAVVAVVAPGDAVPAPCRSLLDLGSIGRGRWTPETARPADTVELHAAGITPDTAAAVARALAQLHDPEDPARAACAVPGVVSLGELSERFGAGPLDDAIAVAAAWRSGGDDPPPIAPIGLAADGVVEVDLARDGPHVLVAGTTGSGKSELLRTFVASLAAGSSPDHLAFVLVDYKGGSTFDACAELPHTVGLVTDLDEHLAERALASLEAEVRRRERVLRAVGAADLAGYRAAAGPPLPRLVVVVDEFAALSADVPGFVPALVGVAQRGRSLGLHLVLATQRPAGIVSDDIRANTNLRLALRVHDAADARDVVGDDAPAGFSRATPGRAMLRLGPDETVVFQAARATAGDGRSELEVLVASIRRAAALADVAPPHRPWLPPLPAALRRADLPDRGAVGLVDVPKQQRQDALRWVPADGNLALLGSRGAGTTTALLAVVLAACRTRRAQELHLYVIDATGDGRLDALAGLTHCAGVVRLHERERVRRVASRLAGHLDSRRATTGCGHPDVVLAVDGLAALRSALDGPADGATLDALTRVLCEGPAAGITTVVTAERPGAVPASVLASCAERWVLHLDDPTEATLAGVPATAVPAAVPGRLVVASSRLAAQIAEPGPVPVSGEPRLGGPPPIEVLPAVVDGADLPSGEVTADGDVELVVGRDFETLGPAVLTVPDGEHVLVAGPARSGRSTALARLAASWRSAHPAGAVVVVAPVRRSPLADWSGAVATAAESVRAIEALERDGGRRPQLVVVDDAERVSDPDGALAALAGERRPGLLVVAAVRPDALRASYGHWTSVVRRSRTGLLLSACADVDGDLLGEVLPRTLPIPSRPGLAWVVGGGVRSLAQLAR